VVALSDSAGDTIQTYEYSAYGEVAAEDPNHPNPFLFTGRRFDFETSLYYYCAWYYNPYTCPVRLRLSASPRRELAEGLSDFERIISV